MARLAAATAQFVEQGGGDAGTPKQPSGGDWQYAELRQPVGGESRLSSSATGTAWARDA